MAERTYLSELDWIMEDWDWEKNNAEGIYPNRISTGSDKYAHWKCHICGNEEYKRCNNWYDGHSCTRCAKERGLKVRSQNKIDRNGSFGDLYPDLAKEFHPTKNPGITPYDLNRGTDKKVWWLCPKGHDYEAAISHRVNGTGCHYCANKKVLIGFNDLATTHPHIAAEWHPTENKDLTPEQVTAGSNKKARWICPLGHTYEAKIANRTKGTGCTVCSGQTVLVSFNDLQSQLPEVAAEWHPTKNGNLRPDQVTTGSNKKIWWKCRICGYEWPQAVHVRRESGCPACANRVLFPGHNDLAIVLIIQSQW